MSHSPSKPAEKGGWGQLFRFVFKTKFCWPLIALALIVGLTENKIALLIPDASGSVYAGDFSTQTVMALIKYAVLYALLLNASTLIQSLGSAVSTQNIRKDLWRRMMRMQAASGEAQSSDSLLTAITEDASIISSQFISFIVTAPSTIYFIFGSFSSVSGTSASLLWPMFAFIPVYIAYGLLMGRWQERTNFRIRSRVGGLTAFFSERLKNLDVIKAYTTEQQEEKNGGEVAQQLLKANMQNVYLGSVVTTYSTLCDVGCTILAIAVGSAALRSGEIDTEQWMSYFFMMPMVCGHMRQLVQMWIQFKGIKGYAMRAAQIVDAPAEQGGSEIASVAGDITLKNVSFSYEGCKALDNVSVTIPSGKMTAIVGPTGSGKSTTLNLIERIYLPDSGSVTVGGRDVAAMDLESYRSKLAYVQQDAGMFSGTIRDAICYGIGRDVPQSELESAAAASGILADIQALPEGFDAKVAMWGESLSGGQRQKLVVARELLRNADVLLLDEATSALDAGTSSSLQNTLASHFAGKTIVTVTHDLRLIAKADQIVVMENGHVAGFGTHDRLMQSCPLYRELVEEQSYQEVYQG